MKAPADPMAELAQALTLSPADRASLRRELEFAVMRVFSAEHEPIAEVEAVLDGLVNAFEVGRARQAREQLQTAVLQIAASRVAVPPGLRELVEAVLSQFDAARAELLELTGQLAADGDSNAMLERLKGRPLSPLTILELMRVVHASAVGAAQAKAAGSRNAAARNCVVKAWTSRKDGDYESKADFARIMATKLSQDFKDSKGDPLKVTARQIETRWLKSL